MGRKDEGMRGEAFAAWRVLLPASGEGRAALGREQAYIGRRMGPFTLTVSLLAALLLAYVNWDWAPHNLLILWVGTIALPFLVLAIVWLREGFGVPARLEGRILRRVPITALIEGLLWAAAPAIL
ncbi:MAG: hypothetical protein D6740_03635, partial [Alphaproteobacteria bacterium]